MNTTTVVPELLLLPLKQPQSPPPPPSFQVGFIVLLGKYKYKFRVENSSCLSTLDNLPFPHAPSERFSYSSSSTNK
ncbi:hypothetical protein QVD17_19232 [Tagetes erecta]|uniref:Uncharacterized protein n=1 Tax=Tagetes erecta TaxID=13708 RepID=A0AAD8KM81_TARER|nr:hypothetical protein QVD17_19232 [Tagetes erecta]